PLFSDQGFAGNSVQRRVALSAVASSPRRPAHALRGPPSAASSPAAPPTPRLRPTAATIAHAHRTHNPHPRLTLTTRTRTHHSHSHSRYSKTTGMSFGCFTEYAKPSFFVAFGSKVNFHFNEPFSSSTIASPFSSSFTSISLC